MSELDIERIEGGPVARLTVDVDAANASSVQRRLAEALGADSLNLVVDLSHIRYVDSAGIDMLLRLSDRLDQRRARLTLVIPDSSPLKRLFSIVGLPEAIAVHPTLDDALAGQRSGGSSCRG